MSAQTLVLVPGYNEPPEHFDLLRRGTPLVRGLDGFGVTCVTFGEYNDTLDERIDRFARFITALREGGAAFPVSLLGYSLGGLIVRGFLRRYPQRAREIDRTILVATPNWGVQTLLLPQIHAMLRTPDKSFADMDLNSAFIEWLNGTRGRWMPNKRGSYHWTLDREPLIAPPGSRVLAIAGLIPARGGDNDGLVWGDSATLGSRIPAHFIVGPHANHMNIIGHFDPLIMLSKGFLANDRVWPLTLRAVTRFLAAQPQPAVEHSVAV
ncbi:MAG: lipase family alpha/beta hydrolase [Candidatus Baltobacteraceae bacterium]